MKGDNEEERKEKVRGEQRQGRKRGKGEMSRVEERMRGDKSRRLLWGREERSGKMKVRGKRK